jgi:predicted ATP-dependent endonuclease of OLD family
MIKLKFNPRYKNKIENSIFLLDEPGSYLHSSAQSELLKELVSVSKHNTIIYCTHSQYLLNPSTIKLGSIRIAAKVESEVSVTNFGAFKQARDKGALSPLYQALGLNFSQDFIGRVVITEGVTDLYFFKMFKEHRSEIQSDFTIVPGSGSGNLSNLISLGLGFADNFLVLFDNDRGAKAIKKYIEEFGKEITNYFHLYSEDVDFKLESFFDKADRDMLARVSGTEDPKKSLALLYYDLKEKQSEVFQNLSKHCTDKLMLTIKRLNEL